ncbi:MAG: hypothetical protein K6V73_06360 [Firmicutes bacterium]|nr:hypothetical protein [Bacillota bacterium]
MFDEVVYGEAGRVWGARAIGTGVRLGIFCVFLALFALVRLVIGVWPWTGAVLVVVAAELALEVAAFGSWEAWPSLVALAGALVLSLSRPVPLVMGLPLLAVGSQPALSLWLEKGGYAEAGRLGTRLFDLACSLGVLVTVVLLPR